MNGKKIVFLAAIAFFATAFVLNGAIVGYLWTHEQALVHQSSKVAVNRQQQLQSSDPGCPLQCGDHGVCKFRDSTRKTNPACLCDVSYATFPEQLCGFDTSSSLGIGESGINQTISVCKTKDGNFFHNPDGPCSVKRVSMVSVACASWIGGIFGADWFVMYDVHECPNCYISSISGDKSPLPYNRGYAAAGFFAILTGDYLTIGWFINSIRILVARESSIPFCDAQGFLHSDTIRGNLING